ncbi:MAG TPA: prepilin-type N-terminal cleavage/methylation domain-containing protein [Phycisphaerales bacterium]|nr:prepilin-type N-terminal cleavage/methylation domain-containing protein [Phycisphaerales bacterium]
MITKHRTARTARRAFSLVEVLIALTISATLLTGALVAFDSMFKRFEIISDSASTNVIARTVMHRTLSMIRTGTDFAPYPIDVLDSTQNPGNYTYIEFVSKRDSGGTPTEITRIERRAASTVTLNSESVTLRGPYVLWVTVTPSGGGAALDRPLLDGIVDLQFNLEYEPGPRLRRATIDMTVRPAGNTVQEQDEESRFTSTTTANGQTVDRQMAATDATSQTIRLVASTSPRGVD